MRHNRLNVGAVPEPGKEFFLPELCLPQALLVLVVLAELLVIVLLSAALFLGWRACDPVKAEQAVLDLADLFRARLAKPGSLATWHDELALSKRYLSIE